MKQVQETGGDFDALYCSDMWEFPNQLLWNHKRSLLFNHSTVGTLFGKSEQSKKNINMYIWIDNKSMKIFLFLQRNQISIILLIILYFRFHEMVWYFWILKNLTRILSHILNVGKYSLLFLFNLVFFCFYRIIILL